MNLVAVIEGLLFAVGDEGLSLEQLTTILKCDTNQAKQLLKQLMFSYDQCDRGMKLEVLGNRLKLVTKKEHQEYYKKLLLTEEQQNLSNSALEVLAIIAYNEPITRVKIDEIRGISSVHTIRKLLARDLIQEMGRSDLPGRPILYGLTNLFYDYFGLSSKEQLPTLEELDQPIEHETYLFETKYKEEEHESNQ